MLYLVYLYVAQLLVSTYAALSIRGANISGLREEDAGVSYKNLHSR